MTAVATGSTAGSGLYMYNFVQCDDLDHQRCGKLADGSKPLWLTAVSFILFTSERRRGRVSTQSHILVAAHDYSVAQVVTNKPDYEAVSTRHSHNIAQVRRTFTTQSCI